MIDLSLNNFFIWEKKRLQSGLRDYTVKNDFFSKL